MARKLTLQDLKLMKAAGKPIMAATAYDYGSIRLAEDAEVDVLFPSDWILSTTLFGYDSPLPATIDHLLLYVRSLARNAQRGFILAPMPFGSYQVSNEQAIANACQLMQAGADSVTIEGASATVERIQALTGMGIPCAGHLGYTPHRANWMGHERVVGDTADEAVTILHDAAAVWQAGGWGIILQNVPELVARVITERTQLITIGVGGTRGCDGYLIATHDLMGWPEHIKPLFSIQYANFFDRAVAALNCFCDEVKKSRFPTREHTFEISDKEFETFMNETSEG